MKKQIEFTRKNTGEKVNVTATSNFAKAVAEQKNQFKKLGGLIPKHEVKKDPKRIEAQKDRIKRATSATSGVKKTVKTIEFIKNNLSKRTNIPNPNLKMETLKNGDKKYILSPLSTKESKLIKGTANYKKSQAAKEQSKTAKRDSTGKFAKVKTGKQTVLPKLEQSIKPKKPSLTSKTKAKPTETKLSGSHNNLIEKVKAILAIGMGLISLFLLENEQNIRAKKPSKSKSKK